MEDTIVKYLSVQATEAEAEGLRRILEAAPPRLEALEGELASLELALEELRREAEKTRGEISLLDEDLKKLKALNENNIIRGKKSRNQREYKAFEKDAKTIETRTKEAEEKYLAASGALDELAKRTEAAEAEFPERRGALLREIEEIRAGAERARAAAEKSEAEKEAILSSLPEEAAALYRKAADGRPGQALAAVDSSTCLACHMNIPPQIYNELHKNDKLMQCPFCHRVMYILRNPAYGWVPPDPEPEPAPGKEPKKTGRRVGRPPKKLEPDNAASS